MKVNDLFTLLQGNSFELLNMELSNSSGINFVSRTAQDNGVVAQVCADDIVKPFPAGYITVALGGSVLSSFVQLEPFYTAFHLAVLQPKKELTLQEKLYYCMCIQSNGYRYSYGRQANKTLKNIELPDVIPEWVYTTPISPCTTANINVAAPLLNFKKWGEFTLGELFHFVKGKRLRKEDMLVGSTNYLGAISENNGIRQLIDAPAIFKENCISVNYNGSVGEAFYQSESFWATDDVNVLYANGWTLNKYIALFIVTVIKANRYKFSYGRKWTMEKMKKSQIKLPATSQGLPDWDYMEQYIKALPYADRI
ncbi:MAG: restriction endonuclease subunit S [Oscillospiraceae bacterium]|nr:restriction endonuclease subunit S [Oscillospiraceae bacterium]